MPDIIRFAINKDKALQQFSDQTLLKDLETLDLTIYSDENIREAVFFLLEEGRQVVAVAVLQKRKMTIDVGLVLHAIDCCQDWAAHELLQMAPPDFFFLSESLFIAAVKNDLYRTANTLMSIYAASICLTEEMKEALLLSVVNADMMLFLIKYQLLPKKIDFNFIISQLIKIADQPFCVFLEEFLSSESCPLNDQEKITLFSKLLYCGNLDAAKILYDHERELFSKSKTKIFSLLEVFFSGRREKKFAFLFLLNEGWTNFPDWFFYEEFFLMVNLLLLKGIEIDVTETLKRCFGCDMLSSNFKESFLVTYLHELSPNLEALCVTFLKIALSSLEEETLKKIYAMALQKGDRKVIQFLRQQAQGECATRLEFLNDRENFIREAKLYIELLDVDALDAAIDRIYQLEYPINTLKEVAEFAVCARYPSMVMALMKKLQPLPCFQEIYMSCITHRVRYFVELAALQSDLEAVRFFSGFLPQEAREYYEEKKICAALSSEESMAPEAPLARSIDILNYGMRISQGQYRRWVKLAADIFAMDCREYLVSGQRLFFAKTTPKFSPGLNFFGAIRHAIARAAGGERLPHFGSPRESALFTKFFEPYRRFFNQMTRLEAKSMVSAAEIRFKKLTASERKLPNTFAFPLYTFTARIFSPDMGSILTEVYPVPSRVHMERGGTGCKSDRRRHHTWSHTQADCVNACMIKVDALIEDLLKNPPTLVHELLKKIGEIHWWFSQAVPYMRGTPMVSEVIALGLLTHFGLKLEQWPFWPDCEAVSMPSVKVYFAWYTDQLLPYVKPLHFITIREGLTSSSECECNVSSCTIRA